MLLFYFPFSSTIAFLGRVFTILSLASQVLSSAQVISSPLSMSLLSDPLATLIEIGLIFFFDGVFGSPSKFGVLTFSTRYDIYHDIFSSSEAFGGSSIPILDNTELNEQKILVCIPSLKVKLWLIYSFFAIS